jgi:hypothetical protein
MGKAKIPLRFIQGVIADADCSNQAEGLTGYGFRSPLSYLLRGDQWGKLYTHTERAWEKKCARDAREQAKKTKKKSGVKRNVSCGYCGDNGHSRRTCSQLATDKANLVKAQRNYRQYVYDTLVKEKGLSNGAIIKVTQSTNSYRYGQSNDTEDYVHNTLCTGVNWDSINLFASWDAPKISYGNGMPSGRDRLENIKTYCTSGIYLSLPALTKKLWGSVSSWRTENNSHLLFPWSGGHSLLDKSLNTNALYNTTFSQIEVVSRAPQVLDEDWVDGYGDELSIIFKKFNSAELRYLEIIKHIEEWANKSE